MVNVGLRDSTYVADAAQTWQHQPRENGHAVDDTLLQYLFPLGCKHINLTGDTYGAAASKLV